MRPVKGCRRGSPPTVAVSAHTAAAAAAPPITIRSCRSYGWRGGGAIAPVTSCSAVVANSAPFIDHVGSRRITSDHVERPSLITDQQEIRRTGEHLACRGTGGAVARLQVLHEFHDQDDVSCSPDLL